MKATSMRQFIEVVKGRSVLNHHFSDTRPNYFVITNYGNVDIYFAVNNYPTTEFYDLKIAPGDQRIYGEPIPNSELYILNPGSDPARVKCISIECPFDITTFAMTQMAESFGATLANTTISTDGQVKGFQTALPAGDHHLGTVGIDMELPEGNNNIGSVSLSGELPEGNNHLGTVKAIMDLSIYGVIRSGSLETPTAFTHVNHINYVTNDSDEEDYIFTIDGQTVTLKPGETVANLDMAPCKVDFPVGVGRYLVRINKEG